MPTAYTPDPTAAQAPSPAPVPENLPVLNIPIATEGRTVSSIEQFVKALGDHLAWLKRPRGDGSLVTRWLQRWRTAQLHTRFALDRHGFPAATVVHWQEWWPTTFSGISAGASVSIDGQAA